MGVRSSTMPAVIAGRDLWVEAFNHASDPVALLLSLGSVMERPIGPPDEDQPDDWTEPSNPPGWWLVEWPEGSNPDRFDESARYRQLSESELDEVEGQRYHRALLVEEIGEYHLYQEFRRWKVIRADAHFIQSREFKTESAAREFISQRRQAR